VKRALAHAIDDPDPSVRAAAFSSAAACGGRQAIDTILYDRLKKDAAPESTIAILDVVSANGLSDAIAAKPGSDRHSRDEWLAAIYQQLLRPEGEVRVRAMEALSRLSGSGIQSLREEDWQAWWQERQSAARAASGGSAR
jgi:hypothetical protein